ncbi:MAG: substrate-binding domain-containing protein, partial [Chitinispirillia bacterium]|nr:substrate-binding domain-containing protein [Chitinispirillia bacterium]
RILLGGLGIVAVAAAAFLAAGCGGKSGKHREVTVVSREESSGTRRAFDELMNISDGQTNALYREAVIVSSTDEAATKVEVDSFAISYTSLGSLTPKVKVLAIDGVAASEANIKNGNYKISRPFVLAARTGADLPIAADFVKFAASSGGQAIVSGLGYITANGATPQYAPSGLSGKLTLSGSTSVERVIDKFKEEYETLNPGVKVEINYNGSAAGLRDCINKRCDLAMSSRELRGDEPDQLSATTFALDGIVVIVNQNNSLGGVSAETVTKIFKGELRYWDDI